VPELFPTLIGSQRLSLCMIVRDEAAHLRRCLSSSAGWVDEIVVVDTGSQDESREIAREFDAKVVDFEWRDDFAAARNFSLAQASGDWAIFLDADEELTPESGPILRQAITSRMEGFLCHLVCLFDPDDPRTANTLQVLRLFRRRPQYHFTGRIHEQLIGAILRQHSAATIGVAPILIKHYGYFPMERRQKQKNERNLKLLRKELAESGASPELLYYLGSEYYTAHKSAQALDYYFQAEAHNRSAPFSQLSLLLARNILLTLYSLKRYPEIIARIAQVLPQYPGYTDLLYFRANSWLQSRQPRRAYRDFVSCVKLGDAGYPYPSTTGFGSFLPWRQLGDLYQATGNRQAALKAYLESLTANPWQSLSWRQLQQLCLGGGEPYLEWQHLQFFFIDSMQLEITARLAGAECLAKSAELTDWRWIRAFLQVGAGETLPITSAGRYYFLLGCAHFFERSWPEAFECFGRIPADESGIYEKQINLIKMLAALSADNVPNQPAPTVPEEPFFRRLQQFLAGDGELAERFFTEPYSQTLLETVKYLSLLRENRLLARVSAAIVRKAAFPDKYETLTFLIARNHLPLVRELFHIYRGLLPAESQELLNWLRLQALLSLKDRNAADRLDCLRQVLNANLNEPPFFAAIAAELASRARRNLEIAQEHFPEFQFLSRPIEMWDVRSEKAL
jgi:tetratricopeptide (TPR) repeat protein